MVGNFDVDVEHQQRIGHLFGPHAAGNARRHGASWTASTPTCPAGTIPKMAERSLFTDHFGIGERLPVGMLDAASLSQSRLTALRGGCSSAGR